MLAKILLKQLKLHLIKYFLLTVFSANLLIFQLHAQNNTSNSDSKAVPDSMAMSNPNVDSLYHSLILADTLNNEAVDSLLNRKSKSAIDAPVKYFSSDSIRFVVKNKKVYLYGKGNVTYEDIELKSEAIELDMRLNQIKATGLKDSSGRIYGEPNFKQGNDVFDADTLVYNFTSKKGVVYGIVTEQSEGILHSQKTKMHENGEIHLKNGKFTTCDADHPHFYVAMTKAKIIPDKQIVSGPAYLVVADIPTPLIVPFGFFPNHKGRASGILMPSPGEDNRGFYLRDLGWYWGFNDYFDLTFKGDIYTLGTWRASTNVNYAKKYKFNGSFYVQYSSLVTNEVRQGGNFKLQWTHNEDSKAHPYHSFGSNFNFSTPGYGKQNARTVTQYDETAITSSINYKQKIPGTGINITLSANHTQNIKDSTISLKLPSMRLSSGRLTPLQNLPFGKRNAVYKKISFDYSLSALNKLPTTKIDSSFFNLETLDKFQAGVLHTIPLQTSFKILKYINVNPSITYNERWYFSKIDKSWDSSYVYIDTLENDTVFGRITEKVIKEFGRVNDLIFSISASTKIYTIVNYRNKYLKAVRHIFTPSISYSLKPDYGDPKYGYWQTLNYKEKVGNDTIVRSSRYSPYDGAIHGVPSEGLSRSISYSFGNNLEAKIRDKNDTVTGTKKVSLINNLSVRGNYNFALDSLRWSNVNISANTKLFKRFDITYGLTLDPYKLKTADSIKTYRSNELLFDDHGRPFFRKTNSNWNLSTSMRLGPMKKGESHTSIYSSPDYIDFSIPWSLNIGYNLNLPKIYYYDFENEIDSVGGKVTQTISLRGNVNITKKWKVDFSAGYDFTRKEFTRTTIDIYRDLHCWEILFNWIPYGNVQRYEFTLRAKASVFKDLKLEKKSGVF